MDQAVPSMGRAGQEEEPGGGCVRASACVRMPIMQKEHKWRGRRQLNKENLSPAGVLKLKLERTL